jgi:desulfoferrodoxin-like iron-binding protein
LISTDRTGEISSKRSTGILRASAFDANPRGKERNMAFVTKKGEAFKCEICGNVVEVKEVGGGELICCGQPMKSISDK